MTLSAFAAQWGLSEESPLLHQALTHRSAAPRSESNERLEFLGDAFLGFSIAALLMSRLPNADEGSLTLARSNIVDRETLADAAQLLELSDLLQVDAGGRRAGLHQQTRPLSDAFEALVAVLYLERGVDAASHFIHTILAEPIQAALVDPTRKHPKTQLQEALQGAGQRKPEYRVLPADQDDVTVEVLGESGTVLGVGRARSQRLAENSAASVALQRLTDAASGVKL